MFHMQLVLITAEINGMECIFIFFKYFNAKDVCNFQKRRPPAGASHGVRKFLFHVIWGFDALLQVSDIVVLHLGIISLKDSMGEAKNAHVSLGLFFHCKFYLPNARAVNTYDYAISKMHTSKK